MAKADNSRKLAARTQRKKRENKKINPNRIKNYPARLKKVEKAIKVFEMKRDGHTVPEIAKALGYTNIRCVYTIINWYMREYLPQENKDDIISIATSRLSDLYRITKNAIDNQEIDNVNPQLLNAARAIVTDLCKINGASQDQPIQTQYNVQINQHLDVSKMLFDDQADPSKARKCNPIKNIGTIIDA